MSAHGGIESVSLDIVTRSWALRGASGLYYGPRLAECTCGPVEGLKVAPTVSLMLAFLSSDLLMLVVSVTYDWLKPTSTEV